MMALKWLIIFAQLLILLEINDSGLVEGNPIEKRPHIEDLIPYNGDVTDTPLELSATQLPTLPPNAELNGTDDGEAELDDIEDDINPDEMMKTSQLFPFRPTFRHRQIMEDRKRRQEWHRRVQENQRLSQVAQSTKGGGSYVQYDRYNNVYLCNAQQCRPAKVVGYYPMATQPPRPTQYYQSAPAWYYNGQYYNVNNYPNTIYPYPNPYY